MWKGTRILALVSLVTLPSLSPWIFPPGLGHPIFSQSHLAGKTPPPLYLATDGRRPDLPAGLMGARGGLGISVRRGADGRRRRRKRRKVEGKRKGGGRWSHPGLSFLSLHFRQRSLYSGLQSSAAAPGPTLGSFAFLPTSSAGAPTPSDLPLR